MPGVPKPLIFILREINALRSRCPRLIVGPIYAATAILVVTAILMISLVGGVKNSEREQSGKEPIQAMVTDSLQPVVRSDSNPGDRTGKTDQVRPAAEKPHRPLTGELTLAFGWQRHPVYGDWRYHQGMDIGAPAGSMVEATFSGEVSDIAEDRIQGLTVAVVSGNDTVLYGSLATATVLKGQKIMRGAGIGTVGTTLTEPYTHLHLAVKKDGKIVNPQLILGNVE